MGTKEEQTIIKKPLIDERPQGPKEGQDYLTEEKKRK